MRQRKRKWEKQWAHGGQPTETSRAVHADRQHVLFGRNYRRSLLLAGLMWEKNIILTYNPDRLWLSEQTFPFEEPALNWNWAETWFIFQSPSLDCIAYLLSRWCVHHAWASFHYTELRRVVEIICSSITWTQWQRLHTWSECNDTHWHTCILGVWKAGRGSHDHDSLPLLACMLLCQTAATHAGDVAWRRV